MKFFKNEKGFTLVELMIVITILTILAAVAIPNFLKAREKARDDDSKSTLKTLKTAIDMYAAEKGNFPANISSPEELKKALGNDYWPNSIYIGLNSGNISDARTNSNGTTYIIISVGRDEKHCWQITETGQITEKNSAKL